MTVPSITQNTTTTWTAGFDDYKPEDGWSATYNFVSQHDTQSLVGTDNGDSTFTFTLTAAQSATFEIGEYKWQLAVSKGSERYQVGEGRVDIALDFSSTTDGSDQRSHVKKVLDALEALIEGKATSDQLSYTIKNRSLSRMSPTEVREWYESYRLKYKQELKAERLKQGKSQQMILARFTW